MKRILFAIFLLVQFGIAGASDYDIALNHTIKADKKKETRVCSQEYINHLRHIGAKEETIMEKDANKSPTKTITIKRMIKLKNEAGVTPKKAAIISINIPLITPRKAPQRISPAMASSAEMGVAIRAS